MLALRTLDLLRFKLKILPSTEHLSTSYLQIHS